MIARPFRQSITVIAPKRNESVGDVQTAPKSSTYLLPYTHTNSKIIHTRRKAQGSTQLKTCTTVEYNSMSLMNHGGSGGGFGGGPPSYRGAHQQGTDGPPRRRPRPRTNRKRNRHHTNSLVLEAQVSIATSDRKRLIGPRGCIIQRLTQSSGTHIHVPKQKNNQRAEGGAVPLDDNNEKEDDRVTVYVKAATIASLLHALWSILELLRVEKNDGNNNPIATNTTNAASNSHSASGEEEEDGTSETASLERTAIATTMRMACRIRLRPQATPVSGRLVRRADDPTDPFLILDNGLAVHCYRAAADFTTEQLETLLDNERFAHSEWSAGCEIVECSAAENENSSDDEVVESILIFIYGTESQYPKQMCQSLDRFIRDALLLTTPEQEDTV